MPKLSNVIEQIDENPPSSAIRFTWPVAARLFVALAILGYLGFRLDWPELGRRLTAIHLGWMTAAAVLFGLTFLGGSLRWQLLLRVQRVHLPLRDVFKLTLIGQFFNCFLLGAAGGDLVKIWYIIRYAPHARSRAALSILVDRALGLMVLLCFAILSLLYFVRQIDSYPPLALLVGSIAVGVVLSIGIVLALLRVPEERLANWVLPRRISTSKRRLRLSTLIAGLRAYIEQLDRVLAASAISVLVHLLVFAGSLCLARAIEFPASFIQVMAAVSVAVCLSSIPISLGGHGVREGAFVLVFTALGVVGATHGAGVGQEAAVLFSLLFFALFAIWGLPGGWIYLFGRRE